MKKYGLPETVKKGQSCNVILTLKQNILTIVSWKVLSDIEFFTSSCENVVFVEEFATDIFGISSRR